MRGSPPSWKWWRALVLALVAVAGALQLAAAEERARLEVTGAGWLKNRELRQTLDLLLGDQPRDRLDANTIEDSALILLSALTSDGFLRPEVEVRLTLEDGTEQTHSWDHTLDTLLPRPLGAVGARFTLRPGQRYHYRSIRFTGLAAFSASQGEEYFHGDVFLLPLRSARVYTPSELSRSQQSLAQDLRRTGFQEATVQAEVMTMDHATGAVEVDVRVTEGPRWRVAEVEVVIEGEALPDLPGAEELRGLAFSRVLEQDIVTEFRNAYLRAGYADAAVRVQVRPGQVTAGGERPVRLRVEVEPGPKVRVGEIVYTGNERTRPHVLDRRVRLQSGDPLDRLELEQARLRLARLGVFERIQLDYEPETGPVRNPVFTLQEGRRWDASLLLGWGSYELLRGGVEMRHFNLFGRAHQSRLLLVQSFKASNFNHTYTMPEIFGEQIDASIQTFGLRREEAAFVRQEFGLGLGLRTTLTRLGADAFVRYNFQSLGVSRSDLASAEGVDEGRTRVASLELGLNRDRRDNPLRPRRGHRLFGTLEVASQSLGGQAEYQRFEYGGSYHRGIGGGRRVHGSATSGIITTFGSDDSRLPAGRRFYPGGESSVRGFQSGRATPRAEDGRFVGAKFYLLTNMELEQDLAPNLAAVVFVDAVGFTSRLAELPFQDVLVSAGLGLRYYTLIGPVRLEYGHNVNPRTADPSGTLHFSIGFPF